LWRAPRCKRGAFLVQAARSCRTACTQQGCDALALFIRKRWRLGDYTPNVILNLEDGQVLPRRYKVGIIRQTIAG
jgi:hypothetical protein